VGLSGELRAYKKNIKKEKKDKKKTKKERGGRNRAFVVP
jgi:hypothetical protein